MKKIYQIPEIDIVKIKPIQMIATSNPEDFNPNANTESEENASGGLGKSGWNWSDEPVDYEE